MNSTRKSNGDEESPRLVTVSAFLFRLAVMFVAVLAVLAVSPASDISELDRALK
jgi:hypothetical protein